MKLEQLSTTGMHVRWLIRRDMREVLDIESKSFAKPLGEEDFLRSLRQRNVIGMVAEKREVVVGFHLYEIHKDHLEILDFAVDPAWRRRGVGGLMLDKIKSKLSSHRRNRVTLNVPETNLGMQLFLRSQGFEAVRVLHGACEDGEDAYRFCYRLVEDGP